MTSKAKKYIELVILIAIPLILTSVWFKSHAILATAEEGIPFYNPGRTLELYRNLWVPLGLGLTSPFYIPRITLYSLTMIFQILNLSTWFIQAIIFFLLLLTPLLSIPRLVKKLVPEETGIVGLLAALFYLCNLFTLSQVFGRFIYSLIFLWAYLPLFLLLWINFLETKKIKPLLLFLISNLLYSEVYGVTASVFALWTPPLFYSFFTLLHNRQKIKNVGYILGGITSWIIVNIWWIYPLYLLKDTSYGELINSKLNFDSLKEVSRYFPTHQIIFLKQSYLFGSADLWSVFYNQQKIVDISIAIFILVSVGISLSKKSKTWGFLLALLLAGWFVSKGANPPFGEQFFRFLYNYFPITQVLRNPYEKFGVAFLLPYSIFFALGLNGLVQHLTKYVKFPILALAFFVFFVYLLMPMWNGDVFPGYTHVIVPSYYRETNNYLKSIHQNGKILQMPFFTDSSVKYNWGYQGEEPSEFLFTQPSVSKIFSLPTIDKPYLALEKYLNNPSFYKILNLYGVDTVILHDDLKLNTFYTYNVEDSRRMISQWNNISSDKKIGELEVFTLSNNTSEVYAANRIFMANSLDAGLHEVLNNDFTVGKEVFIVSNSATSSLDHLNTQLPMLSVRKIDVQHYLVEIRDATAPFILVLSQNYNSLWEAKINNQIIGNHIQINGFANGWVIEKGGNYHINIIFKTMPWE